MRKNQELSATCATQTVFLSNKTDIYTVAVPESIGSSEFRISLQETQLMGKILLLLLGPLPFHLRDRPCRNKLLADVALVYSFT